LRQSHLRDAYAALLLSDLTFLPCRCGSRPTFIPGHLVHGAAGDDLLIAPQLYLSLRVLGAGALRSTAVNFDPTSDLSCTLIGCDCPCTLMYQTIAVPSADFVRVFVMLTFLITIGIPAYEQQPLHQGFSANVPIQLSAAEKVKPIGRIGVLRSAATHCLPMDLAHTPGILPSHRPSWLLLVPPLEPASRNHVTC